MVMVNSERFALIDPVLFWSQVEVRSASECWSWSGPLDDKGYGMLWLPEEWGTARVHRVAYVLGTGRPLGTLNALHSCDNPPCCNYRQHLRAGTQSENMADAALRARIPRKISSAQLIDLRQRYGRGETPAMLAAEFEISLRHARRLAIGHERVHDVAPVCLPEWRERGLALPQIKVTDEQVREIKHRYMAGGVTQAVLAAEYGVSVPLVSMLVNGKHRAEVT